MTDTASPIDLVLSRTFAAPREALYRAFVDGDALAAWFGPVGFSVPRESVDIQARVGGHQRFTMVSDTDPQLRSPVDATFTEVVDGELLVGSETLATAPWADGEITMRLRLEFHDEPAGSRLEVRQGPYPPEVEAMARGGWQSSFTKLDALLAR